MGSILSLAGKRDARKQHKAWDGLVLRADDPFWQSHYPPNGWGCGCYVQSLGPRDLARAGKTGPDEAPPAGTRPYRDPMTGEISALPAGIDPGWDYNVGQSLLQGVVPRDMERPFNRAAANVAPPDLPPFPPPRTTPVQLLPSGLSDEDYVRAFLEPFGADLERPAVFRDKAGTRVVVSKDFFTDAAGELTKVRKRGRQRFVALLAQAIIDPDEIWLSWHVDEAGNRVALRSYLRAMMLPDGREVFAMMEFGARGWTGVTAFPIAGRSYLDRQRIGYLLYRRLTEKEEER